MDYQGKVAVITGGASGIGRALAEKCLELGMKVVLADVNAKDLEKTAAELKPIDKILPVQTDVSKPEQVALLAELAYSRFAAVHLLFNNAGVSDGRPLWESTPADWAWVLGVNVMGTAYAIQQFVPRMMAQDSEAWVINTASLAGLVSGSGFGIYRASKHAAVALSETLYHDLRLANSKIKVAVLCPAWVKTAIVQSARNKPQDVQEPVLDDYARRMGGVMNKVVQAGLSPSLVAEQVFEAMAQGKFYILTHPQMTPAVYVRLKDIAESRPPRDTFAEVYLKPKAEG